MPSLHLNAVKQLPWHCVQTFNMCLSLSSLPEIKQKMWTPVGGSVERKGEKTLSWSLQNVTAQSIIGSSIWGLISTGILKVLSYNVLGRDGCIFHTDRTKCKTHINALYFLNSFLFSCVIQILQSTFYNTQIDANEEMYSCLVSLSYHQSPSIMVSNSKCCTSFCATLFPRRECECSVFPLDSRWRTSVWDGDGKWASP